ncbi:Zinc finger RAD18 domain containing protein [Balamuthia mandrillaris]
MKHEMIHAYLYWTYDKDWQNHGPKFKQMMRIINETEGTHISEYHNFRAEVEFYRSNETASSSASTTTTTKERTLNFYFQNKKRKEPASSTMTTTKHEQGETALPSKASEKECKQDKQEEAEAPEKTSAESKAETLERRKRTKHKKEVFVDLTQEEEDPPTKQTSTTTTTTTTALFSSAAIHRQLQDHVRELNAASSFTASPSCSSSSSSSSSSFPTLPQDSQQQEASCPVCGHLFPPSSSNRAINAHMDACLAM